jgi:hypothetical protein
MTLRAVTRGVHVARMKRTLFVGLLWVALAGAASAEEKFSRALRPEDFAAAGLGKLSAEERSKLDALVEAYGSGALAAAQREAAVAVEARAAAEAKAVQAESDAKAAKTAAAKEKESGGFFSRAKVLLKPGTEVEYETVETRLMTPFRGWDVGTVFTLENGQSWRVESGSYATPPEPGPRKVRIMPGVMGSFFLEIEGVRQKPKVKFVGGGK